MSYREHQTWLAWLTQRPQGMTDTPARTRDPAGRAPRDADEASAWALANSLARFGLTPAQGK